MSLQFFDSPTTKIDFLLTNDNDIDLTGNDITFISGKEYIKQKMRIKSKVIKKESFVNKNEGIPINEIKADKTIPLETIASFYREAFLQIEEIEQVTNTQIYKDGTDLFLNISVIDNQGNEIFLEDISI